MGRVQLNIQLEDNERELLKKYAEKAELSISTVVRRAIREYLIKRKIIKEDSKMFLIVK